MYNHPNTMKIVPPFSINIYICGDIHTIRETCRQLCEIGACVTVTPTEYVFTGGAESGAIVGIIAYARFPKTPEELTAQALLFAEELMDACHQRSCSVVTPNESRYLENPNITIPR